MRKNLRRLVIIPFIGIALASCNKTVIKYEYNVVDKVKLVSNNASAYQLVIHDSQNEYVNLAVSEFSTMIKKASGATFTVVDESVRSIDSSLPFISFGKTELSEFNDVHMPTDKEYLNSGYYLLNKNNNIYVLADEDYDLEGVLYGTYRLLNILVDYKAYSDDEIYVKEVDDIYLPSINESYAPTFDERELGYKELITNKALGSRLMLFNKETDGRWAMHGHTSTNKYHNLLNQEVYHDEHPDWYADSSADAFYQLCYTAHGRDYEAMVNQMATNLFENYIVKKPNAKYFMIGQEDNRAFCTCEACEAKSREYGCEGKVSGLIVLFLNDVIAKVEQIMRDNDHLVDPNRDIKYVFFGYFQSIKPFESNRIVPNENLYIEFAPIELDFAKDFHNGATNNELYSCLDKWDEILNGRIIVYSYDVNYKNFLMNFNNFGSFKPYLEEYAKHHVKYFYSQGAVVNNVTGLTNMRLYIESQLLWNIDQNYDDLVHEFMENYYKDASESLELYYRITKDRYTYFSNANQIPNGIKSDIVDNVECWNKPTVDALQNALNNGLKAIEKYQGVDDELYTKLYYRIKREMITTYYLLISYYSDFYSQFALEEMKAEFNSLVNYFKLTKISEGGSGIEF